MININKLNMSIDLEIDNVINTNSDLKKYINPIVYWADMTINHIDEDKIILNQKYENKIVINSSYLSKGLVNCHKATLITVSIGSELSNYSKNSYEKGDLREWAESDELGSSAVEIVIDKFHNYLIKSNMIKGVYSTLRFSPGYGDWDLKDQSKIINILNISSIVSVNSNFILEPVKSITALIGWSFFPQRLEYPKGIKKKGLCEGVDSCSNCKTWACKK